MHIYRYCRFMHFVACCVFGQSQKLPVSGSSFFAKLPVSDSFCVHQTAGSGSFNCRFRQFKLPVPAILTSQILPVRAVFKTESYFQNCRNRNQTAETCLNVRQDAGSGSISDPRGQFSNRLFFPSFFFRHSEKPGKNVKSGRPHKNDV